MSEREGYQLEFFCTSESKSLVDEFLDAMNELHRAKVMKWMRYLETEGPNLPRPYADIVRGKIRELRVSIAHHQYRFLYFFHGKRIIITHGFLKKKWEVPENEIARAHRFMSDWLQRYA